MSALNVRHRRRDGGIDKPATAALVSLDSKHHDLALKVTYKPIGALKPSARNARTHSKKQLAQIAASIRHWGFTNPIMVDGDGEVIAGHGRLEAARQLGYRDVPTICHAHMSEAEKRAYRIADNRLAEQAGWDTELLALELQFLLETDAFEIELSGFEMAEVDALIDPPQTEVRRDPADEIEEPLATAVTQLGDLWQLGDHRILCGDAQDPESFETLLDGEKAQLAVTDPPFNMPIDGHVSGLGRIRHREFAMACGEMSEGEFTGFLATVLGNMAKVSIDGAIHMVCMDWRHMGEILAAGKSAYTELKNLAVWVKDNGGMGTFYRSQHELVFIFKNGTAPHINNFGLGEKGRYRTNVWHYAGVNTLRPGRNAELALHPTPKPVAMVVDAIKDCSKRGGIVLNSFGGSGTTLIAAHKTGRRGYLLELDPLYVDVTIRRWQKLTGKEARHVRTGLTFDQMVREHEPRATAGAAEVVHV